LSILAVSILDRRLVAAGGRNEVGYRVSVKASEERVDGELKSASSSKRRARLDRSR
jgi:hypothetical protein